MDRLNGACARFADDILVSVCSREAAECALSAITDFLRVRGLSVSERKTHIVSLEHETFDITARKFTLEGDVLVATPSDEAVDAFSASICDTIEGHRGSQESLIKTLNRKISGWASYHKTPDAYEVFAKRDSFIALQLLT